MRCEFNPWVEKIPWRRAWQPIPVFLPGESPWTEEPDGLRSTGSERVRDDWNSLTHMFGSFFILGFPLSCSCYFGKIIQALQSLVSIWILDIAIAFYYIFVVLKIMVYVCIVPNPVYLICCCCCCLVAKSHLILLWPPWTALCHFPLSQARILEWVAISFSRGSSWGSSPCLPHCRQILYCWTTRDLLVFFFFFPSTQIDKNLTYSSFSKEVL